MNWLYIGMLIWSIISLITSISLIKDHHELNRQLDDFTNGRKVSFIEYLVTGVLGYLSFPPSLAMVVVMSILLLLG